MAANPDHVVQGWEPFALPGIDVQLYRAVTKAPRPGTPKIDPNYVFRAELVQELAFCVWPPDGGHPVNLMISGPKGAGKTSLVEQVAAHCNIPVFRANMNVGTTVRHLKGRIGVVGGATVFVPGIVTLAMEQGAWLLMDEVSAMTPPVALSMFPVLEPEGRVLLEDAQPPRYVQRHPDFRVFATDNTIGAMMEDARFSYAGTNPDMNEALLDRFGGMLEVGYLPPEAEYKAIAAKVPTIDQLTLEGMIIVANDIRGSDELSGGFSTRMLIDWARRVAHGYRNAAGVKVIPQYTDDRWILECAQAAFLRKQRTAVERDAMVEVIKRRFVIQD